SHKNAAADDIQISMIPRETMFINNALVLLIFSAHTRGTHDVPCPKETGAVQTTLLVESEQPIRCRSEPLENRLMKPSRDLQTLVCVSVRIIVVVGELRKGNLKPVLLALGVQFDSVLLDGQLFDCGAQNYLAVNVMPELV